MENLKLEEVFKIGGVPGVTFVEPKEYSELLVALRTDGRSIVIEGPSGIGKTTSVLRAIRHLGIDRNVLQLSARKRDDIEMIKELPALGDLGIVMVDDFHKLKDEDKKIIADFMKILADEENVKSKLIVLGINQAGNSLINFAHDLNNRITIIRFETNPESKIIELVKKGEEALNIRLNIRQEVVDASVGSFYIAQMLSQQACIDSGVLESRETTFETTVSFELVRGKVFDRLGRVFYDRTRIFSLGQRAKTEGRAPYLNLLYWLASAENWSLSITRVLVEHQYFKGSVSQIVNKGYLEGLITGNVDISSVLHFEPVSKTLSIEDPQFMYYLRNISWKKFARELGFTQIEFESRYDFALSFAGADRDAAQSIFDALTEMDFEVFYDKNEQHRIISEDVEDYLRPIYMSDAEFVIVILSQNYPGRIWTKFESDTFKSRFSNKEVIPVLVRDCVIDMFSTLRNIGHYQFDTTDDLSKSAHDFAKLCRDKLTDKRSVANCTATTQTS